MEERKEHIETRRLWEYAHLKGDLHTDGQVHLASCPACLKAFNLCASSESVEEVKKRRRAAS